MDRLDYQQLARLEIFGGNIRNIALNPAFLAAGKNQSISMSHLAHSARRDYIKIDKLINPRRFWRLLTTKRKAGNCLEKIVDSNDRRIKREAKYVRVCPTRK